jgi:hypothetical protein
LNSTGNGVSVTPHYSFLENSGSKQYLMKNTYVDKGSLSSRVDIVGALLDTGCYKGLSVLHEGSNCADDDLGLGDHDLQ